MCCGASRSVGLRPQASILLGDEDNEPPRYLKVNDGTLIPNVSTGAQRYIRGKSVNKAIEEGKLEDVSAASLQKNKVTKFRVTLPDGKELDFTSSATARQYAIRNGGSTRVIQEEPDAGSNR